jgi:hypothetical protein
LLAFNVDTTDKLPPLVIGKSENTCCFKNVRRLPTGCVANTGMGIRRLKSLHLSALEVINTVRKYLMTFDVNDNMLAALSGIENEVYRVQQKVKQQQLTATDMWNK